MSDIPASKSEAIAAGEVVYATGKACNRGHVGLRNLNGQCLSCKEEDNNARRLDPDKPKPKTKPKQTPVHTKAPKADPNGLPKGAMLWSKLMLRYGDMETTATHETLSGRFVVSANTWGRILPTSDGKIWVAKHTADDAMALNRFENKSA